MLPAHAHLPVAWFVLPGETLTWLFVGIGETSGGLCCILLREAILGQFTAHLLGSSSSCLLLALQLLLQGHTVGVALGSSSMHQTPAQPVPPSLPSVLLARLARALNQPSLKLF